MIAAPGLCVLLAMAGQPGLPPTDIGVRLIVDRSISSPGIIKSLKIEAETIWAPYGIRLSWLDPHAAPALQPTIDVHVDRRRGEQDRMEWRTVLGNVLVGPDDRGPHPIHLAFDAAWEVLKGHTGPVRVGIPGIVPDAVMARALGRVLAHEIGHVLIGEKYHDRDGLMRANFTTDQLAEVDRAAFRITCSTMERLRAGLPGLMESAASR
jgi:hypothetical protein